MVGENNHNYLPTIAAVISNNFIGTNVSGTAALPNQLDGILLGFAQATMIGGNTISGNLGHGINISKSQLAFVKGNWIGTNANDDSLGNGQGLPGFLLPGGDGIHVGSNAVGITSFGDVIGGSKLSTVTFVNGDGNIISNNGGYGIRTQGFVERDTFQGNMITNNALGGIYLGKGASRINVGSYKNAGSVRLMGDIASQQNTVVWGGPLGTSNTIENNGGNGITVYQANDNELQSNIIESNSGAGIQIIDGSRNLVGSEDPANSAIFAPYLNIPNPLGNQILDNTGGAGVEVVQKTGVAIDNSILTNSIFGNTEGGAPANGISLITE
jgi:parallel beta-helix repeat protein